MHYSDMDRVLTHFVLHYFKQPIDTLFAVSRYALKAYQSRKAGQYRSDIEQTN
jgi:hypothetical protein